MTERCKGNSRKIRAHLIPHSHIDVEWYWTEEEGKRRALIIIEKVLRLMEKDPSFTFSQDNIVFFPYLEESLSEESWGILSKKIDEGKFEIVGGMWVQPEEAEPGGETLIRNISIGKKWIREKFNKDVITAWQIDTFGHIPQLPQILKKSNYKYLVFWRGVPSDLVEKIPNLFYSLSPDGSEILTLWMNQSYGCGPIMELLQDSSKCMIELFYKYWIEKTGYPSTRKRAIEELIEELIYYIEALLEKSPVNSILIPVGSDNFIPLEDILLLPSTLQKYFPEFEFLFSTPIQFFEEIEGKDFEKIKFDFPLPLHFQDLRGTWTGRCELKKAFREYENTLLAAEKFNTLSYLFGKEYPQTELRACWKDLAFTTFHDNIGGSHTDDVEIASLKRLGKLKFTGMINELPQYLLEESLNYLSKDIKGDIVVFNPHSFYSSGDIVVNNRSFVAEKVPPLGYKAYRIPAKSSKRRNSLKVGDDFLENDFFLIRFEDEKIKEIFDKRINKEITKPFANQLVAISHDGDLEGVLNLKDEIPLKEEFSLLKKDERDVSVSLEFGGESSIGEVRKKVSVYEGSSRIDFQTQIDLKKSGIFLKTVFPLNMDEYKIFYSTQFSVVERDEGHFPAYEWVSMEEKSWGVGLINKGNIGYWVEGDKLELALLWSVEQKRPPKTYNAPLAKELGMHFFSYSLYPYPGKWEDSGIVEEGILFNSPLIGTIRGNLPEKDFDLEPLDEKWFIKVDPPTFILTAFKLSEDGKGIVIRGYESRGKDVEVRMEFGFGIKRCWICNLLEEKEREIMIERNVFSFSCKGFEIVSFYAEVENGM